MVHALESIHQLLAPSGRLIDIHPFAEAPVIAIHLGGRITFSEPAPVNAVEDIQFAEKALAHVIGRGLFAVERAHQFDIRTYASSVAELMEFQADQESLSGGPADEAATIQIEELAAHVEQLMQAAGDGAEVFLLERVHMALLRPEQLRSDASTENNRHA